VGSYFSIYCLHLLIRKSDSYTQKPARGNDATSYSSVKEFYRYTDVLRLGMVFREILAHVDRQLVKKLACDKLPKTQQILKNMKDGGEKEITRMEFLSLLKVMGNENENKAPTAGMVARYLRLGSFQWGYWFGQADGEGEMYSNTCGDCCV